MKIYLYDGRVYSCSIICEYEYNDYYHSAPVICTVIDIADEQIEIDDWEIINIIND